MLAAAFSGEVVVGWDHLNISVDSVYEVVALSRGFIDDLALDVLGKTVVSKIGSILFVGAAAFLFKGGSHFQI